MKRYIYIRTVHKAQAVTLLYARAKIKEKPTAKITKVLFFLSPTEIFYIGSLGIYSYVPTIINVPWVFFYKRD